MARNCVKDMLSKSVESNFTFNIEKTYEMDGLSREDRVWLGTILYDALGVIRNHEQLVHAISLIDDHIHSTTQIFVFASKTVGMRTGSKKKVEGVSK